MKKAALFAILLTTIISCRNTTKQPENETLVKEEKPVKGDDQSAACLFEDGKSFSELKQTCLELATLTIKLNPLDDGAKTTGDFAYLLFDDTRSKAEVFFPSQNKGVMLTKTAEGNWSNEEYSLISWKGYVIQKDGKAVFGGG